MNREALVKSLEFVSRALGEDNALVPIFKCFCFTGKTVYAFNDELAIIALCDIGASFATNGKTLLGLLGGSRAEQVEFQLRDHEVWITAGRSLFKLPYHDETEFVFEEPKVVRDDVRIKYTEEVKAALKACLETVAKELTQEALRGVYVWHGKMYSSCGDAITKAECGISQGGPYLLTSAFCNTLLNFEVQRVAVDHEWAYATGTGFTVYGRVPKIPDPIDWELEIKQTIGNGKISYVGVPEELNDALTRARVIADPQSAKTTLTVKDGRLRLYTSTHMGEVSDSIRFKNHPNTEADVLPDKVQRSIALCNEMTVTERCTVYRQGENLLVVLSNIGV
jgi:hypothetical protein